MKPSTKETPFRPAFYQLVDTYLQRITALQGLPKSTRNQIKTTPKRPWA